MKLHPERPLTRLQEQPVGQKQHGTLGGVMSHDTQTCGLFINVKIKVILKPKGMFFYLKLKTH